MSKKWSWIFLLIFSAACKDRYNPPVVSTNNSYLVVEGYLNGSGTTSIRLSHTFKLADTARLVPELNAQVRVESNGGQSFNLASKGNGVYEIASIPFNQAQQYRLFITTLGGKTYASEYVPYKVTPPIDSISWRRTGQGVQVYVNAHDDLNKTTYYHWDYDETWEVHASFYSILEYKNHAIVPRNSSINIYNCWSSSLSSRILLGSSAKLTRDVISMAPITLIPNGSEMLSFRYSIQIRQYALTEPAYQYWLNMQKNTENLGSIFDPQPSEINGNFRSLSNPSELVIGFLSAGNVQNRRIYITNSEVGNWSYASNCLQYFVPNIRDSLELYFGSGSYAPISDAMSPDNKPGYSYSTIDCVDCRTRGTNVKPAFWP